MKAKLVKENLNSILKPKSKEEIDLINERLKRQTNEFMTNIFSDLHKDPDDPNVYRNNNNEWVFKHELKYSILRISSMRVWNYFKFDLNISNNMTKILIQDWLKQNTDWPQFNLFHIM